MNFVDTSGFGCKDQTFHDATEKDFRIKLDDIQNCFVIYLWYCTELKKSIGNGVYDENIADHSTSNTR